METLVERKARVRYALNDGLDSLERLMTEEVTQRLSERDDTLAAEKRHLLQEIEALSSKAARVEGLEADNGKLRAELEATRKQNTQHAVLASEQDTKQAGDIRARPRSEVSTVSTHEYNRVKKELAKSNYNYGKIVFAHQILESRVRYYKELTKQLRAYVRDWILKHPDRPVKPLGQDRSTTAQTSPRHLYRSSSAPTPPAVPNGLTPSASSMSRSTSPQQQGTAGERSLRNHCDIPVSGKSENLQTITNQIIAPQTATHAPYYVASDDLTQSSDGSKGRPGTGNLSQTPSSKVVEGTEPNLSAQADENGDSSPIIVSERSLKRKRPMKKTDEGIHVREDEHSVSSAPKSHFKNEIRSSSPLASFNSIRYGEPHASLDLDEVGNDLRTPKKRQRVMERRMSPSISAPPIPNTDNESILDDIQEVAYAAGEPSMNKIEENDEPVSLDMRNCRDAMDNEYTTSDDSVPLSKARKIEKRAVFKAHNDRVVGRRETAERAESTSSSMHAYPTPATEGLGLSHTPESRHDGQRRKAELASPAILRPTDPNTHILPTTSDGPKRKCPSGRRDHGAAAIAALAEDGEDLGPAAKRVKAHASKKQALEALGAHHRLSALLSEPSPAKELLPLSLAKDLDTPTPIARAEYDSRLSPINTPLSVPTARPVTELDRQIVGSKSSRAGTKFQPAKPGFREPLTLNSPPKTRPEDEPLRSRPLHRLGLQDFKLNPTHSDYLYHESIRKHDEKMAIHGCTAPNCLRCKDMRKFVEHSGYANLTGQEAKDLDQRLMEDFLGGDRRRLRRMSEKERKDILTKARLQQFADKFGQHRQRFDRAQSPVGFWRTDFPTTQENEEDREAARVQERRKVEERYWEAIRKGGRYIFTDE